MVEIIGWLGFIFVFLGNLVGKLNNFNKCLNVT